MESLTAAAGLFKVLGGLAGGVAGSIGLALAIDGLGKAFAPQG